MTTTSSLSLSLFLLSAALLALPASAGISPEVLSDEKLPPDPGDLSSTHPNTVPAFPVVQTAKQTCHLDLSDELFGGVGEACGRTLDRSRCCPVLAAWLFAAHARSALDVRPPPTATAATVDGPLMPDDNQKCVDSLQSSLARRDIHLPRPNATCDTVLCFCGIRLHQIGSLRCPAAFNVSGAARNATPTAAVRELERSCRNASYAGCTRCLQSLEKLKGHGSGGSGDRTTRIFGRDCQLMGLTWLLAKNRTAYIPTVSAVLRAVLYSVHPPSRDGDANYKCSLDQENMPLAVDSLRFRKLDDSSTSSCSAPVRFPLFSLPVLVLIPLVSGHVVLGGT
ncbi:uncharacterized GPI-anchored protein At4g28100-like [Phoenix dactylifera]|uniref:Uncharacterized GPI-anchored protein At4g28100-like n=1 Tax=Phoenix dactylifera TaxID=42345 RepID=A0A8B7CJC7_PHODC|nr:uncharacterized GPI-anchored protein At4g28100-like [Phoenix dactylifera]